MWGFGLLLSNPQIRVFCSGATMPMLLQTLGLGDRIVGFDGSLGSMTTAGQHCR